jgi:hypothetical protein
VKVEAGGNFREAVADLGRMNEHLLKHWPRVDRQMLEASRAASARGEVTAFEDFLRELQGGPD